MKKIEAVENAIRSQESNLANMKQSLETVKKEAQDAPGANVSHSDTSKFQQSNLALGIQDRIASAEHVLGLLRGLPKEELDIIAAGSLFALEDENKEIMYYFFVLTGGGDILNVDGTEITTISAGAPLVRGLMGKKVGDRICFRGRELKVVEVQ